MPIRGLNPRPPFGSGKLRLTRSGFRFETVVDFFDLFGPLLAAISLADIWMQQRRDTTELMAFALVFLGFRLLRPVTLSPTLGPLVLMINKCAAAPSPRAEPWAVLSALTGCAWRVTGFSRM